MSTCGMISVKFVKVSQVHSKSKPNEGRETNKFIVRAERTQKFCIEYLSENDY